MLTNEQIKKIVDEMSVEELVGQVINYDLSSPPFKMEDFEEICKETMPGSFHVAYRSVEQLDGKTEKELTDGLIATIAKYTKIPAIVTTDGVTTEFKTGGIVNMAWGAVNDPELMKRYAAEFTRTLRATSSHILLGPVVDINMNKNNPLVNTRSFSDSAEQVIKMGGAYVDGILEDNNMVACVKHFPGDGVDDRNQHYCTSVNKLPFDEWMNTFGKTYKDMFARGCKSVMCAHISLPSWQPDEEIDPICGYLPCSLSKSLMTDLLKVKLGFDGCIISDAMNMVGAVAVCPREELGVRYIKAGGDMMLFAHPEDYRSILGAVKSGEISIERIKDAATRVLIMKNSIGLIDNSIEPKLEPKYDVQKVVEEAAERVFKIERNFDGVLPVALPEGAKILAITMVPDRHNVRNHKVFEPMFEEFEKRGYTVERKFTPFVHTDLENVAEEYDLLLVLSPMDMGYSSAGTLRMGTSHMGPFWDGLGLKHPKLVYAAFGSPYQLYELPFLHTFVNAYDKNPKVQKNFVKLLLGEIEAKGFSPVEVPGLIKRDV